MRSGAGARKGDTRLFGGWVLPAVVGEGVLKYFRRGKDAGRKNDDEERILDLLDGLPAGFFVLHDFASGKVRIEHILVGPKGIFVLKIRSHVGTVSVLGDQIFRNGRSFDQDKELIRQARQECLSLVDLLARRGITELKPLPVIVFTDAVVGVHGTINGVEVVQRNSLPDFMNRRRNVISPRDAEGIFEFLKIGKAGSPL